MKGALRVIPSGLRAACRRLCQNGDVAIYHFSAKTISRAEGRSSIAAASYRSAERIVNECTGEIHDYTRKGGVVGGGVVLPGGGTLTRSELWNKVEAKHKRGDAVLAREFELALPYELNDQQRLQLVATYARDLADQYRVAVDFNLHSPDKGLNHHAHVMLSACVCETDGSMGKKAVELDPIHCKRAGILNPMQTQRERWQELCNAALEQAGSAERIDHRSLEAQGITDRLPGVHLGPAAAAIVERGEVSEIAARAKRKADEFMAEVQARVAIQAAAARDVEELERELGEARAKAAQPRTRQELEDELTPMLAQLRAYQEVIDDCNRRWPTAKPTAEVEKAKKALPALSKRTSRAQGRAKSMARELAELPWWRFHRKRELAKELPGVQALAAKLARELQKVQAMAKATPLEKLEIVVSETKTKQAELAPLCWPLERQLESIEAQEAAKRAAEDAQQAQDMAKAQEARKAAQIAQYAGFVAEATPPQSDSDDYPRPGR